MNTTVLKVSELFYSLQGEGARAGAPSIFIRLQGCSVKYACFESGVNCDTDFESGREMTLEDIVSWIDETARGCHWIVWTGGEPTDQLTEEIIQWFKEQGFKQAIETSGIRQPPAGLDWVVLSPKVAEHVILKRWSLREDGYHCDELRWVRHAGQDAPETEIKAKAYYISPLFSGMNLVTKDLRACIEMCLENPKWSLSIQQHKIWNVL